MTCMVKVWKHFVESLHAVMWFSYKRETPLIKIPLWPYAALLIRFNDHSDQDGFISSCNIETAQLFYIRWEQRQTKKQYRGMNGLRSKVRVRNKSDNSKRNNVQRCNVPHDPPFQLLNRRIQCGTSESRRSYRRRQWTGLFHTRLGTLSSVAYTNVRCLLIHSKPVMNIHGLWATRKKRGQLASSQESSEWQSPSTLPRTFCRTMTSTRLITDRK